MFYKFLRSHNLFNLQKKIENITYFFTNPSQPLTILHNHSQPLTTPHNPSQSLTTTHNPSQTLTIPHNPSQPLTTLHNPSQALTTLQLYTIFQSIVQLTKTIYNHLNTSRLSPKTSHFNTFPQPLQLPCVFLCL